MQKVEKWRILELSQVLGRLSLLLREGDNAEWANVFSHFNEEAQNLASHETFDLSVLKRLTQNIINCFDGTSSLSNLVLMKKDIKQMEILNQDYRDTIRHLFTILASLEEKWTEQIN
jgi:hypothetical protein